jgi:hypothetical protein
MNLPPRRRTCRTQASPIPPTIKPLHFASSNTVPEWTLRTLLPFCWAGSGKRSKSALTAPMGPSPLLLWKREVACVGEELGQESASPGYLVFVLDDGGSQVATIYLNGNCYAGGGWYDDDKEVLEVRSGVIQLLIAPVEAQNESDQEGSSG